MAETKSTSNNSNSADVAAAAAERHAGSAAHALDAKLSGPLAPLEKALDGVFGAGASYQLPRDIKDLLVKIAPWLALLGGVLGLFSAYNFWRLAYAANELTDSIYRASEAYGVSIPRYGNDIGFTFWLALVMMVVFAVLALLAFPGLKARKKVGWNLMFYSMIASVAYGVASLFFYGGSAVGSLIGVLIGSAVGLYILFQVRAHYVKG